MSAFKRASVAGGQLRQDILAPLKEAQILSSKPLLPAGNSPSNRRIPSYLTGARDLVENPRFSACPRTAAFRSSFQTYERNGI